MTPRPTPARSELGRGGSGPWEVRSHLLVGVLAEMNPARKAMWLNATYSVQLLAHPPAPDVDHLIVCRHDGGVDFPWADLQAIKDSRIDDGQQRWAIEVFPPRLEVVDNCNLRHLWVMPIGWRPPVSLGMDGVQC